MLPINEVKWFAVLTASVAGVILGVIWYSPKLFMKAWLNGLGTSKEKLGNPLKAVVAGAVTTFLTALTLELAIIAFLVITFISGVKIGLVLGLGFVGVSMLSEYMYEKRPLKLLAITAGYRILSLAVMGGILGGWNRF